MTTEQINELRKLAQAAEAELAKLAQQKPVAWECGSYMTKDPKQAGWYEQHTGEDAVALYRSAAPVPAPAVPAYLLERQENGLSWYIGATTRWGGSWHWTADVNSAIRFSREEDAAACWNIIARHHVGIGGSGTTETTPKQHIFEDTRALHPPAVVEAWEWLDTYARHWATAGRDWQTLDNLGGDDRVTAEAHLATLRSAGLIEPQTDFKGNFVKRIL